MDSLSKTITFLSPSNQPFSDTDFIEMCLAKQSSQYKRTERNQVLTQYAADCLKREAGYNKEWYQETRTWTLLTATAAVLFAGGLAYIPMRSYLSATHHSAWSEILSMSKNPKILLSCVLTSAVGWWGLTKQRETKECRLDSLLELAALEHRKAYIDLVKKYEQGREYLKPENKTEAKRPLEGYPEDGIRQVNAYTLYQNGFTWWEAEALDEIFWEKRASLNYAHRSQAASIPHPKAPLF